MNMRQLFDALDAALSPAPPVATAIPGEVETANGICHGCGCALMPGYIRCRDCTDQRTAAIIRSMAEALKPFAKEADNWHDSVPDDYRSLCFEPGAKNAHPGSETAFTVGDLRRAARAVSSGE